LEGKDELSEYEIDFVRTWLRDLSEGLYANEAEEPVPAGVVRRTVKSE